MKSHSFPLRFIALILGIGILSACGQRGPLYLPEKGKPKKIESSVARKAAAVNPDAPPQITPAAVKAKASAAASPPVTEETADKTLDNHNPDE